MDVERGVALAVGGVTEVRDELVCDSFVSLHPGWEEAERSFREALDHQRSGESDDALTAANAAVEAALKAVGMKGQTLKALASSFKRSGLVPAARRLGDDSARVEPRRASVL